MQVILSKEAQKDYNHLPNMNMTPQGILGGQIWEILQDIKEEYLVTEKLKI